jgi:hypothetical protein
MEPILAESAPHRGRAIAFAAALAAVTAIAVFAMRPHPSHHRHHHLRMGKCVSGGYVYVLR